MKRRLKMAFVTEDGRKGQLSITDCRADLDANAVQGVALVVKNSKVMNYQGSLINDFTGAEIITTQTEELY